MLTFGIVVLVIGATGLFNSIPLLYGLASIGMSVVGGFVVTAAQLRDKLPGIKNDGIMFSKLKRRGLAGWVLGVAFTGFYVLLYWYPAALTHVIHSVDTLSLLMRNKPADQWFLYGTFYTAAVIIMGIRTIAKYRNSKYQLYRTISVVTAQLLFAFIIPAMLIFFNSKEFYFHYFWPLKYDVLFPSTLKGLLASNSNLVVFMGFWSVAMTFVATPFLTYYLGKRWYCSWVCGCGGLAETVGDPFRQNSDKSLAAWKVERWMVHGVLVFVILTTSLLWINSAYQGEVLGEWSYTFSKAYGFYIGALFSGVAGVGFYPILGSRVWCRFGCPMAAYLGLLQRFFSKFRITTNGGQCISCGNCSTYCEMGIDVRAYAQRGEDIKRASCVGCGVCAEVCPRGVLKLENK
ncbi:MAG: 4Fe-4S binding protein [Ignavibacteria bacterium]|nr:4Fe-4S binding protein [Ignavibacteria bacterium]